MKNKLILCFLFGCFPFLLMAQKGNRKPIDRCGTMERLYAKFAQDPQFQIRFEQKRSRFNALLKSGAFKTLSTNSTSKTNNIQTVYTIPIVFHIVLPNPNVVTDAQILAEIDTLNKDYSGTNGDSLKIPAWFKPLFGKSKIQFCLVQQTPDGEPTSGIERIASAQATFSNDDAVKHASSNGADAWDGNNYYNVWICAFNNGLLGYATFPEEGDPTNQGVVVDYRSLPGGQYATYNQGKTLSHETGHYFNLYHVWGDDGGACWGTDYIDDTPNQADATYGLPTGIKLDSCTSTGFGIMYENYMDYTDDGGMLMFTVEQVARMESALLNYRSSLLSSIACQPPVLKNYDAQLRSIDQPVQRLCTNSFTPVITIRNRGMQTLTSLIIQASVDGGSPTIFNWTGSLATSTNTSLTLNSITVTPGIHTLHITTSQPNNNADQNPVNDSLTISFQYYPPVTKVSESFESSVFPPAGWDVVNPDHSITWQRTTAAAKTGIASAMIDNYDNSSIGQKDDLRLPTVDLSSKPDSAFLSFQVAAGVYTPLGTAGNNWDTLEVLVSTDCGQTYNSLYKKWADSLVTRTTADANPFVPLASEWRKDSIDVSAYSGNNNVMFVFRNTTGNENNVYIDDVNVRTVKINPNLKARGFMVTPNPTSGLIAIQFYPQPTDLIAIQIYNSVGQMIGQIQTGSEPNVYYNFDLSRYAQGTYFVKAVYTDKVLIKKIVKF